MNKIPIYMIMLVFFSYGVLAYPGVVTQFSDGTSTKYFNFTSDFTGNVTNQTAYVNLAVGSAFLNAYMNISGQLGRAQTTNFFDWENRSTQFVTNSSTKVNIDNCEPYCLAGSTYHLNWTMSNSVGFEGDINFSKSYRGFTNVTYYALIYDNTHVSYVFFASNQTSDWAGRWYYSSADNSWTADGTVVNAGYGWHKFTVTLNDSSRQIKYYLNDSLKRTQTYVNTGFQNLSKLFFYGANNAHLMVDNLTITGLYDEQPYEYPHNVTVYVDNDLVFNFGEGNNSAYTYSNIINFTNILQDITSSPVPITITGNQTGAVYVSELYIEDSERNFTFNFYDENNASIFNLNNSNTTLTISCPDNTQEYTITSGTYKVGVTCEDYDLISVNVEQGGDSYYRTAVLPPNANTTPNIDFYLVDLYHKVVVQRIVTLNDLTGGRWSDSTIKVSRNIGNLTGVTIIEQEFDGAKTAYLYLMKDQFYTLTVTNAYGETWTGTLIADSAGEQTITVPDLSYLPDDNYLNDAMFYRFDFEYERGVNGWANLTFRDELNLTSSVEFYVYDASNELLIYSIIADYDTYDLTYDRVFFYNDSTDTYIYGNNSYRLEAYFNHNALGRLSYIRTYGDYTGGIDKSGFTTAQFNNVAKWFTFLFLCVFFLAFNPKNSHIGLTAVFGILLLFKVLGLIQGYISSIIIAIIGVIAVLNWFRREEVSVG